MRLEQSEKDLIFAETSIPDIFFTEYLPAAKSDYVKVYLYLLFLSKHSKEISIQDLSKKLSVSIAMIEEALSFWEQLEALVKIPSGYKIKDLQMNELIKLYNPKIELSPEDLLKNEKSQKRARAIEDINNSFFQGIMSPAWYNDINIWFEKYQFEEEVMIALFQYCFDKSALHKNYVKVVAEAWNNKNIKTFSELEMLFQEQEKLNTIKKVISKKLRLSRPLTEYEEGYIEKWILEYHYRMDIIELALKKTTTKSNPNFNYLDKLLSDWYDRGYHTVSEIEDFLANSRNKQKVQSSNSIKKRPGYANYEQRDYDNLDFLYTNLNTNEETDEKRS